MPQSFSSLYGHIVFGTGHREAEITEDIEQRLYAYMGGILNELACKLLDAGGTSDHVHLLVSLGREIAPAVLLRELKAGSSKWIHVTFRDKKNFRWQVGYGIFSVSHSVLPRVKQYIRRQKEHHKGISFREEFELFLKKHDIVFDERYLWKG